MNEIKELIQDIEYLRNNLHELIDQENKNLQDPEVIAASQVLNAAIVKYNKIIQNKTK